MIRVIVADDHPAPRAGIIHAISRDPGINLVGEASSGPEVWDRIASAMPDVLLLDINMPDFDALQEVPIMREQYPLMAILIVTAYDDEEYVRTLLQAGVMGYLLKEEDMDTYVEAVQKVSKGQMFFSERVVPIALSNGTDTPTLTPRETEVLYWIARGATSERTAQKLSIARRTVDFHVNNATRKLNVGSRAAAAAKASELGLISAWTGK